MAALVLPYFLAAYLRCTAQHATMINIRKATPQDCKVIARIGRIAVEEAHRNSCSAEDMNTFLDQYYNDDAIKAELSDENNIYHLLTYNGEPAGFSKIILNATHPNINARAATKLDRIYLLSRYFNQQLGYRLLQFNIQISKQNSQEAMWLFTWQGNERAVNFYIKAGFTIVGTHQFKVTEDHYNEHFQMLLSYRQ